MVSISIYKNQNMAYDIYFFKKKMCEAEEIYIYVNNQLEITLPSQNRDYNKMFIDAKIVGIRGSKVSIYV